MTTNGIAASLENRAAIITGGNQGFGLAIARAYIAAGADVLICARDESSLENAAVELKHAAGPEQTVASRRADVSDPAQVKQLVEYALTIFPQVHILVNNAGVHGPKGFIEEQNWNEWVKAVEINLFGSVLMCRALLPHFKQNSYGKIVQVSGGGATGPMPRVSAYAASKAGIVRFVETLAMEVSDYNIQVNALAPGAMNTNMLYQMLDDGPEKLGQAFYEKLLQQKENGGVPLEVGAGLAVFLASSMADGINGKLISAVWDPWAELPSCVDELAGDVYTLRRIVPEDRANLERLRSLTRS